MGRNGSRYYILAFFCVLSFFKESSCDDQEEIRLFKERPSWLKVCKRSDPELDDCLNEVFVQMFPHLAVGIPEVGVKPFEPLYLDKVSISKGSGPITLSGSFINLTIVGPSNATSTFAHVDIARRKMNTGIYLPLLDIRSMYNLKGNILVLPLIGHGLCEMKLFKVDTKIFNIISFPKIQDREILQFDQMKVVFKVGALKVHLHNLFNGNKVLGQTLNAFLNQNSQEILNELGESISESLADIFKMLMNEVFSKIPTDLWLLDDEAYAKYTREIKDN